MLKRFVSLFGAIGLGLGSIVGTGVFVRIGLGAGVAGPSIVLAILVAGLLATCNGISSAQLSANHPVSGARQGGRVRSDQRMTLNWTSIFWDLRSATVPATRRSARIG